MASDWKKDETGKIILGAVRKIDLGSVTEINYDEALAELGRDPIPGLPRTTVIPCRIECSTIEMNDWRVLQLALTEHQAIELAHRLLSLLDEYGKSGEPH